MAKLIFNIETIRSAIHKIGPAEIDFMPNRHLSSQKFDFFYDKTGL